uniref:Peptidase A1 domain-containing protein n=1 Tax=Ananas comosus var. bracteatus TaxID=296719 RepID=A0A6V7QXX9_ANACO
MAASASFAALDLLLLLSLCLIVISLKPMPTNAFAVDLIHRDSLRSPLYDASLSVPQRLRAAARRSHARAELLSRTFSLARAATAPSSDNDGSNNDGSIESEVVANNFEYLMTIHVGSPPNKILAIADTGSDLIWTNCDPCQQCYQKDAPLFDPRSSSTYSDLTCGSSPCSQLPATECGGVDQQSSACKYVYTYGDGSHTVGNLATETLTFQTVGGRRVNFPNVSFGCSHESQGTFDRHSAGLVGLGGGPLSLVSQLGPAIQHKFSYCLIPSYAAAANSSANSTSRLSFGAGAVVDGRDALSTPLVDGEVQTFYTVSLDGISVGGEDVDVQGGGGDGNIIVDSGTTLTYLVPGVLRPLEAKLKRSIQLPIVKDPEGLFELCFDISNAASDFEFPEIALRFGAAAVVLSASNAFVRQEDGAACLAMATGSGLSILGNIAQQNFHIGYDLQERKLSFAKTDCATTSI